MIKYLQLLLFIFLTLVYHEMSGNNDRFQKCRGKYEWDALLLHGIMKSESLNAYLRCKMIKEGYLKKDAGYINCRR